MNSFSKKYIIIIAIILLTSLLLTSCVPSNDIERDDKEAGFLSGIWHGWIAPISLIIGIFNKNATVYEDNNTGWWYDAGFYMAIISGFGGLSLARNKSKKYRNNDE